MVSWEYPPVVYGGLGRHVHGLSEALVADGHDVTVLTHTRVLPPTSRCAACGPCGCDRETTAVISRYGCAG
jgi:glycosyltransferase involved in cell wall biosynthesis